MSVAAATKTSKSALDAVLSAEPFRTLDARGRADVRAAGKLRRHGVSAVVFHAGAPADSLFVLAEGMVRLEPARAPATQGSTTSVRAGELFGDEALVPFAVRRSRAIVVEAAELFELPVSVYRRVLVRAGLPERLARDEARARRAEWLSLARETALGGLSSHELDALASALVEEPRERGELLGATRGAWLIAGGLFELGVGEGGPSRRVYAARGDFVGLSEALAGCAPPEARALGSALALRFPAEALERLAAEHPSALAVLERGLVARQAKQRRLLEATRRPATRHASDEMARFESARSLLAIDLDRCTRCGHCTWACAESHGSARLERSGEKLVVTLRHEGSIATTALLLPSACQHCHDPACLDPCPTGAIRRDATGAVELDADLCTGCGACAKACPWDAIRMAPRPASAGGGSPEARAHVAVKCDLCRGHDGPECVSACPTDAIFRLDPGRDIVEVRAALGAKTGAPQQKAVPRRAGSARRTAFRAVLALAAVPPLVALARSLPEGSGHGARLAFGVLAALLTLVLASHAVLKRVARVRRRARRALSLSGSVSTVSPFVSFHAVSGAVAAASVLLHSGASVPHGVAGALSSAFLGVAASGAFGALVYRFLPERLSRIERKSRLPEDEPAEREALIDALHAAITGANAAKKALVRGILLPYGVDLGGTLALVASGRSLGEEEKRLLGRVERALGARKSARLSGIENLVRTAVEMRAQRARRLLSALLRAWLPLHLAGTVLLLALLALHVIGALR
jgi:Fe-S-cluster-containing dehydrogenase component